MDLRSKSTRSNFTSRKLKTKLIVLKDNYLNFKSILKLVLPFLVVIVSLPIGLVYLVDITYQRRIIGTPEEIPLELRTGVVIIKHSDILYDFDNAKRLIELIKDLYSKKRVTQILIVAYNDDTSIIPSVGPYEQFFRDIPIDNYKIDISSKSIESACLTIEEKYSVQKIVLTSYRNLLPRISYSCNFNGLYAKPYLPKELKFTSREDDFNETLKIILETFAK